MKEDARLGVLLIYFAGFGLGAATSTVVVGLCVSPIAWMLILPGGLGVIGSLGVGVYSCWRLVTDCEACEAALKLLAAAAKQPQPPTQRLWPLVPIDSETTIS